MGDPLAWIEDELARLEQLHLRRRLRVRRGPQRPTGVEIEGREVINFSSNDYLSLAADPRLTAAAAATSRPGAGWGAGASPLISGRGEPQAELERRLAEFKGTEAALLFTSGFAANLGAIPALVGPGDLILSDAKNHASLIDGCRLSGARIDIYPHGDSLAVRERLERGGGFRRRLVVTDSLFSMDGDIAPLAELAESCRETESMLLVDEAHATGVFGRRGRGLAEHLGVEDGVHVRMGTLSKAFGCAGGFVAGSRPLIDWLANRARSYVFSTAMPDGAARAALRALELIAEEPERRTGLLARAAELRAALRAQGWNLGGAAGQIIPLYVGEAGRTMELAERLLAAGLLVPGIRPPSVPVGESLLRISLAHAHGPAEMERLLATLAPLAPGVR